MPNETQKTQWNFFFIRPTFIILKYLAPDKLSSLSEQ